MTPVAFLTSGKLKLLGERRKKKNKHCSRMHKRQISQSPRIIRDNCNNGCVASRLEILREANSDSHAGIPDDVARRNRLHLAHENSSCHGRIYAIISASRSRKRSKKTTREPRRSSRVRTFGCNSAQHSVIARWEDVRGL